MFGVRCGHDHDIHTRRVDGLAPVRDRVIEPEPDYCLLASGRDWIGYDDQAGADSVVMEDVGHPPVRPAVRLPHPTHADHGDADVVLLAHFHTPLPRRRIARRFAWPSPAPPDC